MGYAFGLSKSVLPLWLGKCDLHPKVESLQYLDFSNPTGETWELLEQRLKSIIEEAEQPEINGSDDPLPKKEFLNRSTGLSKKEQELRDGILAYLDSRGFRAMSFDRVRDRISKEVTDKELKALVSQVDKFSNARLKGDKEGLRLL